MLPKSRTETLPGGADWVVTYKGVEQSRIKCPFVEKSTLYSVGHPRTRKGYTSGGPFYMLKTGVINHPSHVSLTSTVPQGVHYEGDVYAYSYSNLTGSAVVAPLPAWSDASMAAYGATAIARFKPNKPTGGLGQFLAELHELPSLSKLYAIKEGVKRFHDLGDKYLNVVFGWAPFISDVMDFFKNIHNIRDRIQKLDNQSGKWSHRRGEILNTTTTSSQIVGPSYGTPTLPTTLYTSKGNLTSVSKSTDRIWFSGSFKFYVPPPNKTMFREVERAQQFARIIFGLELNPRLLWELTPWSWLADWVGNIGDNISNIVDIGSDALVMQNCYIMRHTRNELTYTVDLHLVGGGSPVTSQTYFTEVKQRAVAGPYGFGLKSADLSNAQWAIIGALGLSKSAHAL